MNSSSTAETFDAASATENANAQIKTARRRKSRGPDFWWKRLFVLIATSSVLCLLKWGATITDLFAFPASSPLLRGRRSTPKRPAQPPLDFDCTSVARVVYPRLGAAPWARVNNSRHSSLLPPRRLGETTAGQERLRMDER